MTIIPILLYHSVSADPAGWIAPYAVTPQVFARHVDLIVESGRTPMTVSELRRALYGRTALPSKPVVVTFDDGFADFAEASAIARQPQHAQHAVRHHRCAARPGAKATRDGASAGADAGVVTTRRDGG